MLGPVSSFASSDVGNLSKNKSIVKIMIIKTAEKNLKILQRSMFFSENESAKT